MKKNTVLRGETPSIDTNAFKSVVPLPNPEGVNKSVAALTGQIETEIKKLELAENPQEPKSYGRPKKAKALGREPFTTSLHSDFIYMLKEKAFKKDCTVADILDTILSEHLHKY